MWHMHKYNAFLSPSPNPPYTWVNSMEEYIQFSPDSNSIRTHGENQEKTPLSTQVIESLNYWSSLSYQLDPAASNSSYIHYVFSHSISLLLKHGSTLLLVIQKWSHTPSNVYEMAVYYILDAVPQLNHHEGEEWKKRVKDGRRKPPNHLSFQVASIYTLDTERKLYD